MYFGVLRDLLGFKNKRLSREKNRKKKKNTLSMTLIKFKSISHIQRLSISHILEDSLEFARKICCD
jgi:hypothetical protein